jgi:hypothetical protein
MKSCFAVMSRTSTPGASSLRNQIQKLKETKKLINERYYDGFDIEFNVCVFIV